MQSIHDVRFIYDERVPMRDGITLSADIYLPKGKGPWPTLLHRTPYENSAERWISWSVWWAQRGFAVVSQDCRGKYESDGVFYAYHNERLDGLDTLDWIANQPWCNGKIGSWGRSYGALNQWLSAAGASSALTCMAPHVISDDYFREVAYIGGAFQLGHALLSSILYITNIVQIQGPASASLFNNPEFYRNLPLIEMDVAAIGKEIPHFRDWLNHPTDDDYWQAIRWDDQYDEIDQPIFQQSGWFDPYVRSTFRQQAAMRAHGKTERARANQKVMIGPWGHSVPTSSRMADIDFGPSAYVQMLDLETRWFDHWLNGNDTGIMNEPPINIFVMGENAWRFEHEWPLARTEFTDCFLHSNGHANSLWGDGVVSFDAPSAEPVDRFDYDPANPVWTLGGNNSMDSLTLQAKEPILAGPVDQRSIERRDDVLVYTSAPLEADLEVTGPLEFVLFAASSAKDTDFTAKLIDVFPSGYAMNIAEGIVRARYRNSRIEEELLVPGEIEEYRIELAPTSNLFRRGHRLRLDVSSSNFPRFNRNLNTGENIATGTRMEIARQTILHSSEHPSRLILPIIPR